MKKHYLSFLLLLINSVLAAQTINFSDAAFKAKLLQSDSNSVIARNLADDYFAIDVNNDKEIQLSEALQVAHLDIEGSNISSLDGIEKFTNLVSLQCGNNKIVDLNVGTLVQLTDLNCSSNSIETLTLTGAISLQNLYCQNNKLSTLNLTGLANLQSFFCGSNSITALNLDDLTNLQTFECYDNRLTSLDFSKLTEVTSLNCNFNRLQNLNVSTLINLNDLNCSNNELVFLEVYGLTRLSSLNCNNNLLTALNINTLFNVIFLNCKNNNLKSIQVTGLGKLMVLDISNNQITSLDTLGLTNLKSLYATNNKLATLDVTNQIGLEIVSVSNNLLTSLYLKNGSNEGVLFLENPTLNYICADETDIAFIQEQINQNGYTNCFVNTYCSFVPGGNYYTFSFNNKFDKTSNGCNALDGNFPNLKLAITDDVASTTFIPDVGSINSYSVKEGNYSISPMLENPKYFSIYPPSQLATFPDSTSPLSTTFCIKPNGSYKDLEVTLLPLDNARSNFQCAYKIVYKNKGTVSLSGAVNMSFDGAALSFVNANPSASTQTSTNLKWNFASLQAQETRTILVNLKVNPSVVTGYLLNFIATITNSADEIPNDNTADLSQTVVTSISLNDKICLEGNAVSPIKVGDYLHYMIRFENSGSALVNNIVLKDLIDISKFDITTLVPQSGSHPFCTKISANNTVEFILENINLPFDANNNKGHVAFKIKTLPALVNGDELTNSATLYFDYQKPAATNIATTDIKTLKIQDAVFSDFFAIYPNPVKDNFNILNANQIQIGSVSIYNMLGQLVQTFINTNSKSGFDVSQLKSGVYLAKINSGNSSTTLRFIKE
jgi:uncharacterized repeat protein (TIGR01451 family)